MRRSTRRSSIPLQDPIDSEMSRYTATATSTASVPGSLANPIDLEMSRSKMTNVTKQIRRSTRRSSVALPLQNPPSPSHHTRPPVRSFNTHFSMSSFVGRVEKLTKDQKTAIERVGFGNLLNIQNQMLCKNLLAELMERWDCEKLAFTLLDREVTITPMDVALILGLRAVGDPVVLHEDEPFSDIEKEYGAACSTRKISISSLKERLDSLGASADEDFIWTFLLFTLGTFLLPNSSKNVDSRYLSILKDLDNVCSFAWGMAVIDDLFHWLSRRKREQSQYVGGCLILLQIWAHEHIDIARPKLLDRDNFPRVCHWRVHRSTATRQQFTTLFNLLEEDQILCKLEPTVAEMEINVIKELLTAETGKEGNGPVTTHQLSSMQPIEQDDELDVGVRREDSNTEEHVLEHLRASSNVPEASVFVSESPSASCCEVETRHKQREQPLISEETSVNNFWNDEDFFQKQNRLLESENLELKKERDELRTQIAALQNQLSRTPMLQEEVSQLKKQVEDLTEEVQSLSLSERGLAARLERIFLDEGYDTAEENSLVFGYVPSTPTP